MWERPIGSVRRVFEATILLLKNKLLTKEEFQTLIGEAAAVINSTPLWEISHDSDEPQPLSPAMIIHQRETVINNGSEVFVEEYILAYGPRR